MSYPFPEARLLIFAKAPVAGQCKSRLAANIGNQAAAELQAELIQRCVTEVGTESLCPTELWCAPDCRHHLFQTLAAEFSLALLQQQGADLGQRMFHAMSRQQAEATIIIGTDCPVLSRDHIKSTLLALQQDNDAVLAPAEDGGYVLLGLRQVDPRLFADIAWGTAGVYGQTVQACTSLGYKLHELETLWDIDLEADWQRYKLLKSITYK